MESIGNWKEIYIGICLPVASLQHKSLRIFLNAFRHPNQENSFLAFCNKTQESNQRTRFLGGERNDVCLILCCRPFSRMPG